jgi:DNA sulfur modification protein DndB
MAFLNEENFSELIADRDSQKKVIKLRSKPYVERKVRKSEFSAPEDGWYIVDEKLKREVRLAKDKPQDEVFEDQVWCLLSKLGFRYLSRDRHLRLRYDKKDGASQQIDVLAVDEQCALIVECKSAAGPSARVASFKTEIESLGGKKAGLHREIRERFGKPDLKIAYLLATKNYIVRSADAERLATFNIQHFSEADLEYYQELESHLGTAARYQFEADIFKHQSIPEIDGRVYAVQGSMGGLPYYTFLIEPERLLKIGYVLHRSKSIRVLPSYQRLIKKSRLSAIRKFINNGGYFPNSLVVSVENDGKPLRFEQAAPAIERSQSRVGVLHLPNKFRSLYIIDGQHRLYGYSESNYEANNLVPVVAFDNLDRNEQLKLFMEINENQKAVSKNLKHTLDADLKWDSANLAERAEGIKKQLCQELGEDTSSPLFNRVLVGEDQRTETKVITLDAILRGLNQTPFVGKFTRNEIKEQGVFNVGDSSKTLSLIKKVLIGYFSYVQDNFTEEWERLPKEGALLTINDGVTAQIQLIGDIIQHMVQRREIAPLADPPSEIVDKLSTYIDGLKPFFIGLSDEERAEIRSKYGSGAPARLRRIFQRAIHQHRSDFDPPGLSDYWRDQSKQYNIETYARILDIETLLREQVKEALQAAHGEMWLKKGLSEKLYTTLVTEAAKKNRTIAKAEDEKSPWDCLNLIHLREIMLHQAQWSNFFQKQYTIPGQEGLRKEQKTNWLVELNRIRNVTDHEYSVKKSEADYVAALADWLLIGSDEAIQRHAIASEEEA